jgi:Transcription- and export-related complex subunit
VEAYPNMVEPYVEALRYLTPLGFDVLTFAIIDRLAGSGVLTRFALAKGPSDTLIVLANKPTAVPPDITPKSDACWLLDRGTCPASWTVMAS